MDIPFWLICSSVGQLDCFHFLAVRVILVCILVHKFLYELRFAVFLSVFLEEDLLDNMVILNLTFCGWLFSIGLYHFAFLPALYKGSNFAPSSPTLVIIAVLVGVEGLLVFPKVHKHRVLLQT